MNIKNIAVSLVGLPAREFDKFFDKLTKTYQKKWKKVLKDSTRKIKNNVKRRAPVSKKGTGGGKPGDFKRSISFKLGKYGLVSFLYETVKDGKRTKAGYIGHLIEFGTRSKKQTNGKLFAPEIEKEKPVLMRNLESATAKIKDGSDI